MVGTTKETISGNKSCPCGVGQFLRTVREGRGLARAQLAEGLCPVALLEKIEAGQAEAGISLLEILLQRLGIAPRKLEFVISRKEYQFIECRDRLTKFILGGRGDWAQWLLSHLWEGQDKVFVHGMLYHRYQALYQYYIASDKYLAAEELARALLQTSGTILSARLPINAWLNRFQTRKEEGNIKNRQCLLSVPELENLLALVRVLGEIKEISAGDAVKVLCWCREYIDHMASDGDTHAIISCRCAWLLAGYYRYQKDKIDTAFDLCDGAFEELQNYGIGYFMQPLLERMLSLHQAKGLQRKKKKYEYYLHALEHVYQQFGFSRYPKDSILCGPVQGEYYLEDEVLRGGRLTQGYTQEETIEGIYTSSRSLSQIENGRTRPTSRNFAKLIKKLNLPIARCHGSVVTDSADMLAKVQELRRLVSKEKYVEMEKQIRDLRQGLDMSVFENQRAIRYFENMIDYQEGNRAYQDILWEDYQLLAKTYDIKRDLYRPPFRQEAEYINQIAILLWKTGRREECISCYRKVLKTYQQSRVKARYHFLSRNVMLGNLAAKENFAELAQKAIQDSLECGKVNLLYYDCMTYLCTLEDAGNTEKEKRRAMLQDVIVLCSLVKNEKAFAIARQYYDMNYKDPSI